MVGRRCTTALAFGGEDVDPDDVGRELVIAPLDAELATLGRLHELVAELRR